MEWKLSDDRPIWLQLSQQLARRILVGAYPPGSRLPSVRELVAEAGVIVEQYFEAMAELGFSRQEAVELLREEAQ